MSTRDWQVAAEVPDQEEEIDHIDEWLSLFATRDEFAGAYAQMLFMHAPDWPYWREINEAIVRRWSMNALRYIKTKAWKIRGGA